MPEQSLVRSWLRDARKKAAAPKGLAEQIAWLEAADEPYWESVKSGDWEVNSDTYDGSSSTSSRKITDKDHHDAILAAIEQLELQAGIGGSKGGGSVLSFRIHGIQS